MINSVSYWCWHFSGLTLFIFFTCFPFIQLLIHDFSIECERFYLLGYVWVLNEVNDTYLNLCLCKNTVIFARSVRGSAVTLWLRWTTRWKKWPIYLPSSRLNPARRTTRSGKQELIKCSVLKLVLRKIYIYIYIYICRLVYNSGWWVTVTVHGHQIFEIGNALLHSMVLFAF